MKKLSVTLLALGFSAAALAQESAQAPATQAPSFEEVDENTDGMISREEAQNVEALDFDEADENEDGRLDREEYRKATEEE